MSKSPRFSKFCHSNDMRTEIVASAKLGNNPVFAIATADSERIYAACGTTIQILSRDNQLQKVIQTQHSQTITYIAVNADGQKIVTVGLDGQVVFIDPSGTALFKYTHNSEIQCCGFSDNCEYFLTCADQDIGIYAQGAQKVQKYKVDGLVRCCAWSPGSQWFCIGLETGTLLFMDLNGQIFNKIDIQSPVWAMKIVYEKEIASKASAEEEEQGDEGVQQNDVGLFMLNDDTKKKEQPESKTQMAAKEITQKLKISDERLLIASWDQRYRVLDPSVLAHSGVLVAPKASFFPKKRKVSENSGQILLAESKIPFIPLCMQLINGYIAIAGVGGKIVFLNAETGAHLIDICQLNDADPYILGAPRVKGKIQAADEQRFKEMLQLRQSAGGTLSWFGFNQLWIYSLVYVKPNYFFIGLQNGVVLSLQFQFNAVDALYKNFYAVREGLTNVIVKNLTTEAETKIDVGAYVQKIAIFQTHFAVLSGEKLDIYELIDSSTEHTRTESVLRLEHEQARRNHIFVRAEKSHIIKFQIRQILLADKHFILVGNDYITALGFDGASGTSWKFKNSILNCVKVIGGVPGEENILVGTNDGRVLVLKIGNRFPVEAIKHDFSIIDVDISAQRDMLLILDSQSMLSVFDFFGNFKSSSQTLPMYQITKVHSAAFDLVLPNVLSYASDSKINICINGAVVYTYAAPRRPTILAQNGNCNYNYAFTSDVMGFSLASITHTEIPVTPNITHHIKRCYAALAQSITEFDYANELNLAIMAAALGAPYQYWQEIAVCGLFCGQIQLAKEALSSIGNVRVLKTIAEVSPTNEKAQFQYVAIALSLCGHYSDASMLFAASGDMQTAMELLYFTRQDGQFQVGPNSSTISLVTQKMIQKYLGDRSANIQPLPNLALYYKLGTSDEDICKFRKQLLESRRGAEQNNNKYLDFLQIYEQDPTQMQNASNQQYSYSSDFRIMLRRQLSNLCQTPQQRQELIARHSRFLESVQDWQASSSSWLDAGDPEKAVQVLIQNNQTNTLLKLVRMLPAVNKPKEDALDTDDFNYDAEQQDVGQNTLLLKAFNLILQYFEKIQDFDSALYIAQRLNDASALLRLLVAQNLWDQVEALAEIYPKMAPAVHEARASALLREGRFMEALERLRMAGNNEKELGMIKALIDAAVVECKFDMARGLICQLAKQVREMKSQDRFLALKCLRARILVFSAYSRLARYVNKTFRSPDPNNVALMRGLMQQKYDPAVVAVCTFLTAFAAMPPECATADDAFLRNFESVELQDQEKTAPVEAQIVYINSQTKPQLGSLSQIDLGSQHVKSLPPGVPEPVIWLALVSASGNVQATSRALKRLSNARLPQGMAAFVRHKLLAAKTAQPQSSYMCDQCPRCGAAIEALPQTQVLMQRDYEILSALPMCTPAMCDVCKCGIPLVRSAVSLRILPLILVEPADDSSVLELIEHANSVQIADLDENQAVNVAKGNLVQQLKDAPVVTDGRGVQLPKDCYSELSPERCFVLDDYYTDPKCVPDLAVDNIVKRVYCLSSEDIEVHFCENCQFFFEAAELEQEFVLSGRCPICANKDLRL